MAAGTYTSPKRVERDGRLIAFAGEVMTMEEAEKRGLVVEEPNQPEPKAGNLNKDDLIAKCVELGIEVPPKTRKADIEKLLADHEAASGAESAPEDADPEAETEGQDD